MTRTADCQQCTPAIMLLTGLPGAGKSTLAYQLRDQLRAQGQSASVLDGDVMRKGLSADLGFTPEARSEHIRRMGEVAKILQEAGVTVLMALIAPQQAQRALLRAACGAAYVEVWCAAGLDVCEARDPKGMYARARRGELPSFTGVGSPYEAPAAPDLALDTGVLSEAACLEALLGLLGRDGAVA